MYIVHLRRGKTEFLHEHGDAGHMGRGADLCTACSSLHTPSKALAGTVSRGQTPPQRFQELLGVKSRKGALRHTGQHAVCPRSEAAVAYMPILLGAKVTAIIHTSVCWEMKYIRH
jgi:hypothetical protein